jgi:hypothetical protein
MRRFPLPLVLAACLSGQAAKPEFEVASVKPSAPARSIRCR